MLALTYSTVSFNASIGWLMSSHLRLPGVVAMDHRIRFRRLHLSMPR